MSWWDKYVTELASPSWSAGLTQSLLAAGAALAGAILILRQQLRADRELAATQRRIAAADSLGRSLLNVVAITDNWTSSDWFRELTSEPVRGPIHKAPGDDSMLAAEELARIVLPQLDDTVAKLAIERAWLWRATAVATQRRVDEKGLASITPNDIGVAADSLLNANKNRIHALGISLCRWDGFGSPPGRKVLAGWTPAGKNDFDQLIETAIAEIERLDGFSKRSLLSRLKALSAEKGSGSTETS